MVYTSLKIKAVCINKPSKNTNYFYSNSSLILQDFWEEFDRIKRFHFLEKVLIILSISASIEE